MGASLALKKKSMAKLMGIKEGFEFCDIWRIRSLSSQSYTLRQKHFSGLIQRRLYYIFLSNSLQEFASKNDILPAFSRDHSPVTLNLSTSQSFSKESAFGN